jgi:hypothetical protein
MGKYTHDYEAFDAEVLCADFMVEEMRSRAYKIADRALSLAAEHYDATDDDGDHYIDHFSVEAGVRERKTKRAYGSVINDHVAAIDIEYGTVRTAKQRILGRALDAAAD